MRSDTFFGLKTVTGECEQQTTRALANGRIIIAVNATPVSRCCRAELGNHFTDIHLAE